MNREFEKKYYNQSILWEKDLLKKEADRERIIEIIKTIPQEVETILDVGCGNGSLVNSIYQKFKKVVGVDLSEEALTHVKSEKVLSDVSNLCFPDKSFDLVVCSEVLEHLREEDYLQTIKEIERVAKRYIILTVPNNENLRKSSEICPDCQKWFHPSYHQRSFKKKELETIFKKFNLIKIKEMGDKYPRVPNFMVYLLRWLKKPGFSKTSLCPFCGYQEKTAKINNSQPESFWKSKLRKIFPQKHYWLFAFYQIK